MNAREQEAELFTLRRHLQEAQESARALQMPETIASLRPILVKVNRELLSVRRGIMAVSPPQ